MRQPRKRLGLHRSWQLLLLDQKQLIVLAQHELLNRRELI